MLRSLAAAAALVLAAAGSTPAMGLRSPDFRAGGTLARAQMAGDCGGANRPPSLAWSGIPVAAKSLALIVRDPDAPLAGGFYHWVVYDVPPGTTRLDSLPAGSVVGLNSIGRTAYYGPCPPAGPAHHYVFTLYALDRAGFGGSPLTGPQLEAKVRGHVLARATLAATAAHP